MTATNWINFKIQPFRVELGFDLEDWSLPLSINFVNFRGLKSAEIHLLCFYAQITYERAI